MTPQNISQVLQKDHGIKISKSVVRKLLKKHSYRRRKAQRRLSLKSEIKNRNEQFENIARIKAEFEMAGNPIISMDTKKKEDLGNFYRDGHLYTREELKTFDHDFKSYAEGTVVPHSFYDLKLNVGYVQLVSVMIPVNFHVIAFVIGGIPMVNRTTPVPPLFSFSATGVEATVLFTIYLNKIYKH